ncbi:MAG: alanine--glyoxylate aminotransferase family protein [Ignavibacteria bacterium]|nr:alanine--glyoxylate aminotransferase family protein [Ignavibacteria bacterium]
MKNKMYFTVGPTEIFSEVKDFYLDGLENKIFSVHHRSNEFEKIHSETVANLKILLNIPKHEIFFFSSGTECMERIILNLIKKKSFHLINGYFGARFFNISLQYGNYPSADISVYGSSVFEEKIEINHDDEIICFTLNETSTGVALQINDILNIKKQFPGKIIVIDAVSAVPYYEIPFDYVDCAFFSVQKGFGMPPGLGVLIVNDKCMKKAKSVANKKGQRNSAFNFNTYSLNYNRNQTSYTPNIPAICVLGKVCELMLKKGLDKIRNETEEKYALLDNFISGSNIFSHFVKRPEDRSKTTIAVNTKFASSEVVKKLYNSGFVVSSGYGEYKDSQIRIGNFPVHKISDFKNLIDALSKI